MPGGAIMPDHSVREHAEDDDEECERPGADERGFVLDLLYRHYVKKRKRKQKGGGRTTDVNGERMGMVKCAEARGRGFGARGRSVSRRDKLKRPRRTSCLFFGVLSIRWGDGTEGGGTYDEALHLRVVRFRQRCEVALWAQSAS